MAALKLLDTVQAQLAQAEDILLQGDAMALERASTQVAHALLHMAQQRAGALDLSAPRAAARLRGLAVQLSALREGMARRQAMTERELRTLIPQASPQVYGRQRSAGYTSAKTSLASLRA